MSASGQYATKALVSMARLACRAPVVKNASAILIRNSSPWYQLLGQRALLENERNELRAHCDRLEQQLEEGHQRELLLRRENEGLLRARDMLESERNRLAERCRSLSHELMGAGAQQCTEAEYLTERMRGDWDDRARLNAEYYTASSRINWDEKGYVESGEENVAGDIQSDLLNICQGKDAKDLRVLEIGCGAGRMTGPLARIFGEVHAVDISSEMIRVARQRLLDCPNVFLYQNNGRDLSVLPGSLVVDFAFSFIVFQHIPSAEIIAGYLREVHRILKPGGLFKFQVLGQRPHGHSASDTWLGIDYSVEEMQRMAAKCNFEMRHWYGEGTQYFWLWFFKR
jgi:SAM-dependent methyltransferase